MTPERWARVEELFHAAYARPTGERAAFLATSCGEDETLRRAVEALLNESSHDGFLDAPTFTMSVGSRLRCAKPARLT